MDERWSFIEDDLLLKTTFDKNPKSSQADHIRAKSCLKSKLKFKRPMEECPSSKEKVKHRRSCPVHNIR